MTAFSAQQVQQLRAVFREELADVGLRIDGADHIDDARRDFMFLRNLRRGVNGAAAKVGWAVIASVIAGLYWLIQNGVTVWRGHP